MPPFTLEQPLFKDIIWIVGFLIITPIIAILLKTTPKLHPTFLWLLIFTTCYVKKPLYMELFFVSYRGVDRGFGITLADFFFFGYLLYLLASPKREKAWWPYNFSLMWVFFLCCGISLLLNYHPFGLFSLHKLFRGLILYWVIVNIVRERKDFEVVISALICVVFFEMVLVLLDRYVLFRSLSRSRGSFPHPNSLAMYTNMIICLLFALILAVEKKRSYIIGAAIFFGVLTVVFTKSRGGLIMIMMALPLIAGISFLLKPNLKKVKIVVAGVVLLTMMGIVVAPKIIKRFQSAPEESLETRGYLNSAAIAMANDNFFGVGTNLYSWMLSTSDYYWYLYPGMKMVYSEFSEQKTFREKFTSRQGTCHNIYLLWAAESGWITMYVFILMIAGFYILNIVLIWKVKDTYYNALLIGLLAGFSTLHIQGLGEWIFRQTPVFYLFHILSGLLTSIYLIHIKKNQEVAPLVEKEIPQLSEKEIPELTRKNLAPNGTKIFTKIADRAGKKLQRRSKTYIR